jgi:DNA-binding SARP family transcriptional activator
MLAGLLWGERPDRVARRNLRTEIWRIRQVVEAGHELRGRHIVARAGEIGFNTRSPYWLDVEVFEQAIGRVRPRPAGPLQPGEYDALRSAMMLYRGDALEGLYEEWCATEQERLRGLMVATLETMLRHHAGRGEWAVALDFGERILRFDPLREHIHREVMLCHIARGDRPAAAAHFHACRRLLRAELGIEPMPETVALYRAIQGESDGGQPESPADRSRRAASRDGTTAVVSAVDHVRAALRDFEGATAQLIAEIERGQSLR